MEWQWHQSDHMQIICTSLHTDQSIDQSINRPHQYPTTQFFTGWTPFLLPNEQHQSNEGNPKSNWSKNIRNPNKPDWKVAQDVQQMTDDAVTAQDFAG